MGVTVIITIFRTGGDWAVAWATPLYWATCRRVAEYVIAVTIRLTEPEMLLQRWLKTVR